MTGVRRNLLCSGLKVYHKRCYHTKIPSCTPRRIIFGSCSDCSEDLTYWDTILSLKPDVVLLMGDNVYSKSSTLAKEYDKLRSSPSFQRAQDALCILATVDDNDLGIEEGLPLQDAVQLFKDMFRPKIPEKQKGFYQAYEWNHQLQILLLDIRSFASPFMSVDRPGATPRMQQFIPDCDPSKSMLGVQQWEWLEEMLSRDFDHRLVVSPLQVLATGHGFECWRMLPHERERLLRLLQGKNALIFSGDRHVSALYKANGIYEITASSFTHTVPLGLLDKEFDQTRLTDFCYQNNFGMLEWYYDGGSYFLDATIRSTATGEILMQWLIGKNLGSSILVVGNETRPKGR